MVSIILSRMLDTAGFASYSYFQITASMLAAYAAMGLGVTASKFFSESACQIGDSKPPIGTLWALSILMGLLMAIAIFIVPSSWIRSDLDVPNWLLAFGVFTMSFSVIPGGGIVGLGKFSVATLASAVSFVGLVSGALVFGRMSSPKLAMLSFIFSSFIQAAINSWIVAKTIGLRRLTNSVVFGKRELIHIFRFASSMVGVSLLASSGTWFIGRILLGGVDGKHQFSIYVIGLQWLALALYLPGMIARAIFPELVKSRIQDDSHKRNQTSALMRQSIILTAITVSVITCIAVLLSPWLIRLYGSQYASERWVIVWFMIAALPMAPAASIGNGIVANNGQHLWFIVTAIWFFSVLALAFLLRDYGAAGAAISYGLGAIVLTTMAYGVAIKKGLIG